MRWAWMAVLDFLRALAFSALRAAVAGLRVRSLSLGIFGGGAGEREGVAQEWGVAEEGGVG